jgi:hypothetical protein
MKGDNKGVVDTGENACFRKDLGHFVFLKDLPLVHDFEGEERPGVFLARLDHSGVTALANHLQQVEMSRRDWVSHWLYFVSYQPSQLPILLCPLVLRNS